MLAATFIHGRWRYTVYMSRPARDFRDLSVAERIQLVEDIWDSIAFEGSPAVALTDAQLEELRRRYQAHAADPSNAIPWEDVRVELLRRKH
jgi:putative addiction module component (TIGR02574 family)